MSTLRSAVRPVIVLSLALSLSITGLYPQLLVSEGRAAVRAEQGERGAKACCCGTEDGRCCGLACCQMPNPRQDKAPSVPNRFDGRAQPFGLTGVGAATVAGHASVAYHGLLRDVPASAHPTLIALRIRLNC